jgi:hypothetical protein
MYLKLLKGSSESDVMLLVGCFWLHPQIPEDWICDHAPSMPCRDLGRKVRVVLSEGR